MVFGIAAVASGAGVGVGSCVAGVDCGAVGMLQHGNGRTTCNDDAATIADIVAGVTVCGAGCGNISRQRLIFMRTGGNRGGIGCIIGDALCAAFRILKNVKGSGTAAVL